MAIGRRSLTLVNRQVGLSGMAAWLYGKDGYQSLPALQLKMGQVSFLRRSCGVHSGPSFPDCELAAVIPTMGYIVAYGRTALMAAKLTFVVCGGSLRAAWS